MSVISMVKLKRITWSVHGESMGRWVGVERVSKILVDILQAISKETKFPGRTDACSM
jgi:hypothetical protein